MNNTLVEEHSLLFNDRGYRLLQLNCLVDLIKHIQNRLNQIVVHSSLVTRHGSRQILQDLVHTNTNRIFTHQSNLSQRANSLTTHFPIAQHSSLLQTNDNGLVELAAVHRLANRCENINTIAKEPVGNSLQIGNVFIVLFTGRDVIQKTEYKLVRNDKK